MKNFALIGAAGYIAPRHLKAIKETDNNLIAVMDISDSVGILDSYFPDAEFFTQETKFRDSLSELNIDYFVVCTPNHLHKEHIMMGLYSGCDVICEKPLVIDPYNFDDIKKIEQKTNKKVYAIQQLRLHPAAKEIRQLSKTNKRDFNKIEIRYYAPRGKWYDVSWKGNEKKSGGLIYNIGIHLLDLLCWLYGDIYKSETIFLDNHGAQITIWFEKAKSYIVLETYNCKKEQRKFIINGQSIDLTQGFQDLHTESYRRILDGKGFGVDDVYPAICLAHSIRTGVSPYEYYYSSYGNSRNR